VKIAVLGAGGVGGVYGGLLARAGHDVVLLARGEHLAAIRSGGLSVTTPEETFTANVRGTGDPADLAGAELAIVAVKTYSLGEVAPAARAVAESGAAVLPLLNGVEAPDRLIASGVPRLSVLGGLTEIGAVKLGPGAVAKRSPFARVALGELGGGGSGRAEAIAAAFRSAGVEARVSTEIAADLWRKLAFIASMAAGCGLARAPIGAVRSAPFGRLFFERAVREALDVARARGVPLDADAESARILAFIDNLPPSMQPSLLTDLQAGRPTEIDDLSGAVARFGRLAGVETKIHDTAAALLSGEVTSPRR
jgi:2-dehydropantoate 2-reductase